MKKIIIFILAVITSGASMYGMETPLIKAASDGDLKEVKRLVKEIKRKERTDYINEEHEKYNPLVAAVKKGHFKVVEYLINNGAEVNSKTEKYEYTPLHFLARGAASIEKGENVKIAVLLLKHGADPNAKDSEGRTPAKYARQVAERYKEDNQDIAEELENLAKFLDNELNKKKRRKKSWFSRGKNKK